MTFTSQMKRSSKKSVSSTGTPDDFASLCSCLMLKVAVTKKTTYICRLNLPAKILIKHCCVGLPSTQRIHIFEELYEQQAWYVPGTW